MSYALCFVSYAVCNAVCLMLCNSMHKMREDTVIYNILILLYV